MNRKFLSSLCLSFMFFQLHTALPTIDDFLAVANVLIGNESNEDRRNNEDRGSEANIQNADDRENNEYGENNEDDVGEHYNESEERKESKQDTDNNENDKHGESEEISDRDEMTRLKIFFENNANEEVNKDEGIKQVEATAKDEIQIDELNVLQQLISDIGVGNKKCQGGCSFGTICVHEKCEKLNILT